GRNLDADEADVGGNRPRVGCAHVRAVEVDCELDVVGGYLDARVVELVVVHRGDGAVGRLGDAAGRRVERGRAGECRSVRSVLKLRLHDIEVADVNAEADREEKGQHPEGTDRED